MAVLPCSVGHHRYPGKANTIYVAVGARDDFQRYKARLCDPHAQLLLEGVANAEITDDLGEDRWNELQRQCRTCGRPLEPGRRQVFLTVYAFDQDRRDYWFALCPDCDLPAEVPVTSL